ncbi:MAG: ECF transporter S component [Eubacteriales bacterium]|nr:ECF transporter S component [Eubacteriales bacterium]
MKSKSIKRMVHASIFAALICIATITLRFPSPIGYVNLGDGIILIAAWVLGPVGGMLAGGIGSALADLIGYPQYMLATLVIKGLSGLVAGLLFKRGKLLFNLLVAFIAETIMAVGYFGWESLIFGQGLTAAAGIPFNILQGVVGIVIFALVYIKLKDDKFYRM